MIYEAIKDRLFALIKAPGHPPEPPAGSRGSVQTFRADPNFLKLRLIVWGVGFAGAIVGELIFLGVELFMTRGGEDRWAEAAVAVALLALTIIGAITKFFLIRLDYDMRYYVVTDRSLRIREGALHINESTYTFANIQNLKVTQGPLERLLGLSNLIVETAGGAASSSGDKGGKNPFSPGHEGNLRGIANAREVRDQMLVLLKKYRDAGLGDPEDRGKAMPRPAGGFTPAVIERLGEVLEEVRHLGRVLPVVLCVLFATTGCGHTMYDPDHATAAYPFNLHESNSVDIQVFRKGPTLEIVNSTPVTYRDIDIWINQRFTRHLDVLPAGATLQLSLWDFWDLRGDRFSGGGFWRTEDETPVRLVEFQLNDDQPLVGLVAVYEQ